MRIKRGHAIPEFSLALFVLLFLVVFPLLDFISLGIAAASSAMLVNQAASRAAASQRFPEALDAVKAEALSGLQSGIARFSKMQPINGYMGCGVDLFIQATDIHNHNIQVTGPNVPLTNPPDPMSNVYEYAATGQFQVSPLVPMASLPLIGQIPGLGQPVILKFSSSKAMEHVSGLNIKLVNVSFTAPSAAGPYPGRTGTPKQDVPEDAVGWNYPNIYDAIAAKGQVVVAEDVFTVPANQEAWTISKALCAPGQHVWIDTHAEGQWSFSNGITFDANGQAQLPPGSPPPYYGLTGGALISQVGNAGPVWCAGATTLDYVPQSSGLVEFRMNDTPGSFVNNMGVMVVRVIVTKAG